MAGRPWVAVGVALAAGMVALADPPREVGPAVVVDADGAETRLDDVKLTAGTRRLGWLADPAAGGDAAKGPLALEVREPNSTTYAKGVLTLVPVSAVEAVRYDYAKLAAEVRVKGLADPLAASLQYKNINVLGIEGRAGDKAARFTGGVLKTGVRSVAFPDAKPPAPRAGGASLWSVQVDHPAAKNPWLPVRNLKVLTAGPTGTESLAAALPARKGDPVPLADGSVKQFDVVAVDPTAQVVVVEVRAADGKERLAVVPLAGEPGGKTGTLVGLIGEVDAGWKLFPLQVVKAVRLDGKKPAVD